MDRQAPKEAIHKFEVYVETLNPRARPWESHWSNQWLTCQRVTIRLGKFYIKYGKPYDNETPNTN